MQRAFTSKLVPQDPDDEPASVLLERIQAERAVASITQTRPQERQTFCPVSVCCVRNRSESDATMTNDDLANEFHQGCLEGYEECKKELGYNAIYFLQMLHQHGGFQAAKLLLNSKDTPLGCSRSGNMADWT